LPNEFPGEKLLIKVIGDLADFLPYFVLVGGWIPYIYAKYIWKDVPSMAVTTGDIDFGVGNHDMWALDWALRGDKPEIWTSQGGDWTMASYGGGPMPQTHIDFLKSGQLWIERENQVFVHGGFNPDVALASHSAQALVWDRQLFDMAWKMQIAGSNCQLGKYADIFVGHTTTEIYDTLQPIHACNVWNLDTGAGWSGKLTIMDVDTKEYWQSDLSKDLYGGLPNQL
jgi:serine/threonine protein phosphatase 1